MSSENESKTLILRNYVVPCMGLDLDVKVVERLLDCEIAVAVGLQLPLVVHVTLRTNLVTGHQLSGNIVLSQFQQNSNCFRGSLTCFSGIIEASKFFR